MSVSIVEASSGLLGLWCCRPWLGGEVVVVCPGWRSCGSMGDVGHEKLPGGGHENCPDTIPSASPRPAVDTVKPSSHVPDGCITVYWLSDLSTLIRSPDPVNG